MKRLEASGISRSLYTNEHGPRDNRNSVVPLRELQGASRAHRKWKMVGWRPACLAVGWRL